MVQAEGWDRPRQQKLKAGCSSISPLRHSAAVAPAWLWSQRCHRNTEINQFYLGLVNVQHKKSPETSPTGPDLIFLSFKFGERGSGTCCCQQLCSPPKAIRFAGQWGETSPPLHVSMATLQTREPKPLVWQVPERWAPRPCSARYSLPVGSQLPVVQLPTCTAPSGHAGLNQQDKNSSKGKAKH